MVEAYWTMYCDSEAQPYRGGSVVFAGGSVVGHDLEHEFHGTYQVTGDRVRAEVSVWHYGKSASAAALPHRFDVVLEGKAASHRMVLRGRTRGGQPYPMRIVCLKRSGIHQTAATAMVRTNVHDGYAEISAINGSLSLDTMIQFLEIIATMRYRRLERFLVDVRATAHGLSADDHGRLWTHAAKLDLSRSRTAYLLHDRPLTPDATVMEAILRSQDAQFRIVHDHNEALEWLGLPDARPSTNTGETAVRRRPTRAPRIS